MCREHSNQRVKISVYVLAGSQIQETRSVAIQWYLPRAATSGSEKVAPRRRWPPDTGKTVVGTSQKWPAKEGGRSPKGLAVAGTTVPLNQAISLEIQSRLTSSVLVPRAGDKKGTFYILHYPVRRTKWFILHPGL